jgi:hypothetical protein
MDIYSMHELFLAKSQQFLEACRLGKSSHTLSELHRDLTQIFSVLREKLFEVPHEENLIY